MKKSAFILLTGFFLSLTAFSQNRLLTIEDATGRNTGLNPSNLSQLQWMGKSLKFSWVTKNMLICGKVRSNVCDTLLKLDELNAGIKGMTEKALTTFPQITFLNENQFLFHSGTIYFIYDLSIKTGKVINRCDPKAENMDLDEATFKIAFTKGNNLYISDREKETAITSEINPGIVYGSNRVHRNEFGIDKGTFWSPKGNYLAFYRMDETMVTDYPLVNTDGRIAKVEPAKYPMAGMTSHQVMLCIYDFSTQKTSIMQTGEPVDQYLTNISWSPDEKFIYIALLNRDQNHMQLNKYDVTTGVLIKTLFEERNEKYVEPQHEPEFLDEDPTRFIWQSQRDGYNHLYLYDSDGNMIRQLTNGPWVVTGFLKYDRTNSRIFFLCNKDNPLEERPYRIDLKKGEPVPLTNKEGKHTTLISADGRFIIDKYSNYKLANQIEVLDDHGSFLQMLLENTNPLKEYKLGEMSVFTLKNDENLDLYCRMIKPADFDSGKRYPVIIYVYGGPHSQLITNSWLGGAGLFLNYLAEQGYVVFTLDNRGTSNRGLTFEQAIFRNLGVDELSDPMCGVRFLQSLPYIDSTRIGLNGWSYGGFMALTMMLKKPGTFKVGVCGGPVTDWKYYEVMYGERYMDTPESNPEGYRNASLLNYVKDLQGKLLIIHDDQDETVVLQNSLTFLKKCVDEGKQVDFFIYPGHPHNVRGKDRVHLNQKMVQYFRDYL